MGRIALMARENNRLSAIGLANKKPGFHPDGRGLYLSVNPSGSRSWIFRYMLRGRSRDMGLGSFPDISLSEARNAATDARARCAFIVRPPGEPLTANFKGGAAYRYCSLSLTREYLRNTLELTDAEWPAIRPHARVPSMPMHEPSRSSSTSPPFKSTVSLRMATMRAKKRSNTSSCRRRAKSTRFFDAALSRCSSASLKACGVLYFRTVIP